MIGAALAAVFVLVGAGLVVWGVISYNTTRTFVDRALSAPGRVVDTRRYETRGTSDSRDTIVSVVAFSTPEGREIRFEGPDMNTMASPELGEEVTVLYDPENPTQARVDSFVGLWFVSTLLLVIGGGFVLVPFWTLWEAYKWIRKQEADEG